MAKKGILILVFVAFVAGGVFAQEAQEKTADVKKFWISGEVSLLGAGARGEYMLTPNFSVGLDAYWTSLFFFWNDIGVNAVGRFYPWGKIFHVGLGLDFGFHTGTEQFIKDGQKTDDTWLINRIGFDIVPEVGWKIDLGNPGGFYLNPLVQLPLTLGIQESAVSIAGSGEGLKGDFGVSVGVRVALGLGWAF